MTDFTNTGDSGKPIPKGTTFQNQGVTTEDGGNTEDNTVVLELGGRKFTKSDLVKKLTSADEHIERLTKERAEDRALLEQVNKTLEKQVTATELLHKIQNGGNPSTPAAEPVAVNVDDIKASIKADLQAEKTAEQMSKNWDTVTTTLTKMYGEKTNEVVAKVAADSGLTLEEAEKLAKSRPQVFLRLFDPPKPVKQGTAVGKGSVNSQSFTPSERGSSGFSQAKNTKQSVSIYLTRLKELGVE